MASPPTVLREKVAEFSLGGSQSQTAGECGGRGAPPGGGPPPPPSADADAEHHDMRPAALSLPLLQEEPPRDEERAPGLSWQLAAWPPRTRGGRGERAASFLLLRPGLGGFPEGRPPLAGRPPPRAPLLLRLAEARSASSRSAPPPPSPVAPFCLRGHSKMMMRILVSSSCETEDVPSNRSKWQRGSPRRSAFQKV